MKSPFDRTDDHRNTNDRAKRPAAGDTSFRPPFETRPEYRRPAADARASGTGRNVAESAHRRRPGVHPANPYAPAPSPAGKASSRRAALHEMIAAAHRLADPIVIEDVDRITRSHGEIQGIFALILDLDLTIEDPNAADADEA